MNKRQLINRMLEMADKADLTGFAEAEEAGTALPIRNAKQDFYKECAKLAKENGYTIESVWDAFCREHRQRIMSPKTAKADDIKKIRDKTGMSRREFREEFGIPERTLQNWENGVRVPSDYIVALLDRVVEEYCKSHENK